MHAKRQSERPRLLVIAAACALVFAILAMPSRPQDANLAHMARFPVELALIAGLLAVLPRNHRALSALRGVFTALLGIALLVKCADLGLHASLNRPFNFAYDLPLLHAGWMLATGTSGALAASLYLAAGVLALAGAVAAIWWATGVLARLSARRTVPTVAILLIFAGALVLTDRASTASSELLATHVSAARSAQAQIASLEVEARSDDVAVPAGRPLMQGLAGRDVFLVFIESYGRSTLENPLYATSTKSALGELERAAERTGLEIRSAYMTAPMVGGQSWLAHASILSGLWIDSQGRYRALLASSRRSLMALASDAGWHSVAVMPAITMAWPEGSYFGYDRILAKDDLGYRGLPFNWVTMPDQYTLSAFERLVLDEPDRKPVFAEIALISSHAPWTPIPELVDWDVIGDGTIFNPQALAGDSPETLWRDHDRVRAQFGLSIDYSLRTVASFVERQGRPAPLIVVLGDHQPAVFVSGNEQNRDVPVHFIGDSATLDSIEGWSFESGAVPGPDAPVWRMDEFRKRFVDAFDTPMWEEMDSDEPA
ncbi:sulfatase [Mesorhizobium sp. YIM 152430]|uniref:sulfatase-like hydrolase/transferase n=1 Tax=Mesorhizobium sp. YIM 152430 TaxID=3031761 RepID=UPI0023DAD040|nr:sulfatase-like hydrolase/transferase [Mesorhizobium sp. YIM 152430]MDF1600776.1 sulfatase [Mesorhizobium sp. YIM 152430]